MCVMRKVDLLVFLLSLLLFSCAAPQDRIAATVAPSEIVSVNASATSIPDQTVVPKLIPKQNDLVFIEFFAVT